MYFYIFKPLEYWEDKPLILLDVSPAFTAAGIFVGTSQLLKHDNTFKGHKATDLKPQCII